jgi:hypothetical protein
MWRYLTALSLLLLLRLPSARAQEIVKPVFLEPAEKIDTQGAEIEIRNPLLRPVADDSRYVPWLNNESARRAFRLYRAAYDIVHPEGGTPAFYIALVPGGNHAATGFRLHMPNGVVEHKDQPYILLDAEQFRFDTTLLHETGHMAMALVAGARPSEVRSMASIPHSTAALSDRSTAFREGYAIHLETLQAHVGLDPWMNQRYRHGQILFGSNLYQASEYFREAADLATYSQTVARYGEVRDNHYSFDSAFQGPDYLRVQLEKARDFSTVRDANQLLQSEGFYASFFFQLTARGEQPPDEATITRREAQTLMALHGAFARVKDANAPWLLEFVVQFMKQFPDDRTTVVDALNELSHGVFVDAGAAALWKDHYFAALHLDMAHLNRDGIAAARKRWHDMVLADPSVLFSRLGPEIRCTVPGTHVRIAAFENDEPLTFDLNTVPPGILRIIPGIAETEITAWLTERARQPFTDPDDFRARGFLRAASLARLTF